MIDENYIEEKMRAGVTEPDQISPEEMAKKLAPVHPLRHVMFSPKEAIPLRPKGERANFRVVNDSFAALIPKLAEVSEATEELRLRLTGINAKPGEAQTVTPPDEQHASIFDHLAYQALLLARLVGDLKETVSACQDAVK
ncbi:MAG: hypothetical protein ABWY63_14340 [Hyphomicrobiaceae bacterium]